MAAKPWYRDGLRFECQPDCGACCTNHGEYAHVYLENDDVARLARHLELTPTEFRRMFTQTQDGWTLLQTDDPSCPFLDGTRCSVYLARPAQCRTFPFWQENLRSAKSWERLATFCPGIGRGRKRNLLQIRSEIDSRDR